MSRTTRTPHLLDEAGLEMCRWTTPVLAEVVTLSEAVVMFGKSVTAIKQAIYTHKVDARLSFTGGTWIITLESLIRRYGQPTKDVLSCLKDN